MERMWGGGRMEKGMVVKENDTPRGRGRLEKNEWTGKNRNRWIGGAFLKFIKTGVGKSVRKPKYHIQFSLPKKKVSWLWLFIISSLSNSEHLTTIYTLSQAPERCVLVFYPNELFPFILHGYGLAIRGVYLEEDL